MLMMMMGAHCFFSSDADADFSRYPYRFSASARLEAVSLNGLLLLLGIMVYMLFL